MSAWLYWPDTFQNGPPPDGTFELYFLAATLIGGDGKLGVPISFMATHEARANWLEAEGLWRLDSDGCYRIVAGCFVDADGKVPPVSDDERGTDR